MLSKDKNLDLIDKINAHIRFYANNCIALENLKAMNKKFVLVVVRKEPRKTERIMEFKTTNAMIVIVSS
jgi:hypothetical protein